MLNKLIVKILPLLPKSFVWLFSKKYIAGAKLENAIKICKQLNSEGIKTSIDYLGEFITNLQQAEKNKRIYIDIIEATENAGINGNYSIKPTMFGLLIDEDVCYENIKTVVKKAIEYNNFVRLDMEDSQCVDKEIKLFQRLKTEFPQNIGLVFQAYLRRTFSDLENLNNLNTTDNPLNYRLCKGIYIESEKIAYKTNTEINKHFVNDLEFMITHNIYPAIATHDKELVKNSIDLIKKYKLSTVKYEFQMLYGVTPELRKSILKEGHKMRVYVPYGKDWFGYSIRRLKENPQIANHIIKAIFSRK